MTYHRTHVLRLTVVAAAALVATLPASSAEALAVPPRVLEATFAADTTVGDTAAATVSGTNPSSRPISASAVKLLPSCAGTVVLQPQLGCSAPDVGVFTLAPDPQTPVSGDCGITGFTVGPADGAGVVTVTPVGGLFTVPAGGTCTLHLLQTAHQLPTDVDAQTPGAQTATGAGAVLTTPSVEADSQGTNVTVHPIDPVDH